MFKPLEGVKVIDLTYFVAGPGAARILAEEKTTVLEAMYRVGISTPAYFRKCFRETFGCLPSEYRHNKPGQG